MAQSSQIQHKTNGMDVEGMSGKNEADRSAMETCNDTEMTEGDRPFLYAITRPHLTGGDHDDRALLRCYNEFVQLLPPEEQIITCALRRHSDQSMSMGDYTAWPSVAEAIQYILSVEKGKRTHCVYYSKNAHVYAYLDVDIKVNEETQELFHRIDQFVQQTDWEQKLEWMIDEHNKTAVSVEVENRGPAEYTLPLPTVARERLLARILLHYWDKAMKCMCPVIPLSKNTAWVFGASREDKISFHLHDDPALATTCFQNYKDLRKFLEYFLRPLLYNEYKLNKSGLASFLVWNKGDQLGCAVNAYVPQSFRLPLCSKPGAPPLQLISAPRSIPVNKRTPSYMLEVGMIVVRDHSRIQHVLKVPMIDVRST